MVRLLRELWAVNVDALLDQVGVEVDKVVVLEAHEVEGVPGSPADDADAGVGRQEGPQAGSVEGVEPLSTQPHRDHEQHWGPLRVWKGRKMARYPNLVVFM